MAAKINLAERAAELDRPFAPKIVAYLNDYKVQIARVHGEFVWHSHPETADFFLVVDGRPTIQLRDGDVELGPAELYVVPCGVEHCPRAEEETHILLIEPRGTVNTGDAGGPLTAVEEEL